MWKMSFRVVQQNLEKLFFILTEKSLKNFLLKKVENFLRKKKFSLDFTVTYFPSQFTSPACITNCITKLKHSSRFISLIFAINQ